MLKIIVFIISVSFCAILSDCARILAVFPTPSISHQVVFRPLTQELAKRGHQLVVLTTDPLFQKGQSPANLTEIDFHDRSYELWSSFVKTSTGKKDDLYTQLQTALDLLTIIVEDQIQSDEVQKILKDKTRSFDLLLVEACARPALVFSHVYKVPMILISSLGAVFNNYHVIGGPTHPLLYPNIFRQKLSDLSMWDKINEIYFDFMLQQFLFHQHEKEENAMLQRIFGPNVPTISELSNNVDMLFLNVHPIWEGNFPVPPNVVYMGGLHQKPSKELPQDLKTFLDSSKHGVIYMSFGTNTLPSSMPAEKIQTFVKIFSELPYNILWKWDKDVLPGQSKNIRIGKWFPQSDLLKHPNIKLFLTQGGLQSTDEAITAEVPLIGMPFLGDQWFNVEKYLIHKIGVRLDLETLTEKNLKQAIDTVIKDESYKINIKKLHSLMRDEPMPALERSVWWVEHVLRHNGARHLRSPAHNMSWARYYELELVFTVLSILFIFLISVILILYFILRIIKNSTKIKKS